MRFTLRGLAVVFLLGGALAGYAEDRYKWSWEEGGGNKGTTPPPVGKDGVPPPPAAAPDAGGVKPAAYDELLRENLELRQRLGKASKTADQAQQQNAKLANDLQDTEKRMAELAETVQRLKLEKKEVEDRRPVPSVVVNPPAEPPTVEAQKALQEEIEALRKVVADLKVQRPPASPTAGVSESSQIYKDLERKYVLLQEKLVQIDEERAKAVRLIEQLTRRLDRVQEGADTTERDLRANLSELKTTISEKDAALRVRDKEVDVLTAALEKTKTALLQAQESMRTMTMERNEMQTLSKSDQRDQHYNRAVLYAKEGRYQEAEREYLEALDYDPGDADIHYNLGILYDDDLKLPEKAMIHYQRYLKLSPTAADADTVREWIMRVQMGRTAKH